MAIQDQLKEAILTSAKNVLDNKTTPLSDFESFVVTNPDIVDPGIDVSGLRTTTDANILGNITDFPGIQYEAYNPNRLSDLMRLYSSGLPTTDTAQIPGAIDTLVDVGGGGGMDQVTGDSVAGFDPGVTPGPSGFIGLDPDMDIDPQDFAQEDYGIYDPTAATGQIGDGSITVENIAQNQTPYDVPMDIDDPGASIENIIAQQNLSTIPEAPVINQNLQTQGPTTVDFSTGEMLDADAQDIGNIYDEVALTGTGTPEQQQGFLQDVLGRAGQTVDNALTELGKVPGAVVDFANQTVDVFGQKLNVGKTLASAAINKIVGGPISLVFDALGALGIEGGRSDLSDRLGEQYGMDDIGRLTGGPMAGYAVDSAFGDIRQATVDRINKRKENNLDTQELEQFLSEIDYLGGDPVGANTELDIATGNITGDASVAEREVEKEKQQAFADIQNQIGQSLHGGDDNKDKGPSETPDFGGFDSGGFDPAPAPAPADIPDRGRGQNDGGGGGGSSGGGESGFGGFCFDPNTPIQMANGSNKKIKDIQLGDDTKGGEVTGVFQFKATDEIHDYKGVTVAGSHYVKEDCKFIMVQDSPISIKIDKIPVVYSLDTTGRRIFIKDIEFADYNGDGIAKVFLHNAGVNTKGFDKEVLRQVEQRLI